MIIIHLKIFTYQMKRFTMILKWIRLRFPCTYQILATINLFKFLFGKIYNFPIRSAVFGDNNINNFQENHRNESKPEIWSSYLDHSSKIKKSLVHKNINNFKSQIHSDWETFREYSKQVLQNKSLNPYENDFNLNLFPKSSIPGKI
jgi:hypothetical protein